jgi:antibiotic biosynthesis monooxygenase (ABM) superfamily enzyme
MKFFQTIRFSTSRIEEMQALMQEYDQQDSGSSPGFIGSKVLKDRDRDNAYVVIAEFESYDQAMENSGRPETDAFAKKMATLVDGELGFNNYDVIDER